MKEIWKGLIYDGEDYSEWIEVSSLGRVRNPKTKTVRKQNLSKNGYYFVNFSMGSRTDKKTFRVHKGLAETFIPNPENKSDVNHKDGNKKNNDLSNLEWNTRKENINHAFNLGLAVPKKGVEKYNSKLSEEQVRFIRKNYKRSSKYGADNLAKIFNVHATTIRRAANFERYTNIT